MSKRVKQIDPIHGEIIGDLTMHGVTKEVILKVEFNGQAENLKGTTSAGFNAVTRIDRKDWNLEWNKILETGGMLVGDEITINIELQLVDQLEAMPVA